MKKKLFTLGLSVLLSSALTAQLPDLDWAISTGFINHEYGYGITTDSQGNIYCTGIFYGETQFGNSAANSIYSSNGHYDVFIYKLDTKGDLIWAHTLGGASWDSSYDVVVDKDDNVFVCGSFQGEVDFNPGPGIDMISSNGDSDAFVLKLDSDGNYVWAKTIGGIDSEIFSSISMDENRLYLGGYFTSDSLDMNPGAQVYNAFNQGGEDAMMICLLTTGDFENAQHIASAGDDRINGLCNSPSHDVYATGYFSDVIDLDPTMEVDIHNNIGQQDVFVVKMTPTGKYVWGKTYGSQLHDNGNSIKYTKQNEVLVTGIFQETMDIDPGSSVYNLNSKGSYDCFVQKLTEDGDQIWALSFGGENIDKAFDIEVDNYGNSLICGSFTDKVNFNPGTLGNIVQSEGSYDGFALHLSPIGKFKWVTTSGNVLNDSYHDGTLDNYGSACFTGSFRESADFFPGPGVFTVNSNGGSDVFVQKLELCKVQTTIDQVTTCGSYTWIDGVTYNQSTTATVVLAGVSGCDSTVELQLEMIEMNLGITSNGGQLTANQPNADSYQWIDCSNGLPINGATSQTFTPQSSGSYAVVITLGNCQETTLCTSVLIAELEEFKTDHFVVSPNPSNGEFAIDCPSNLLGSDITLMDISGAIVYKGIVEKSRYNLQISASAGTYLLHIGNQVSKVIIE